MNTLDQDVLTRWTTPRDRDEAPLPASVGGGIDEYLRQSALDRLQVVDTGPSQRFDRITRLAKELLGVEAAAINFIDHDRQWAKSQTHDLPVSIPRVASLCNIAIQQPAVLVVVPDTLQDDRFNLLPAVLAGPRIRFYAAQPLLGAGGEPVGTLCVADSRPRRLTGREVAVLRDLATWAQEELDSAQDLSAAARVQQSMLPAGLVSLQGYEVAGKSRPLRAVGGDFYDWYPVRGGAAITLADVMGKGLPAALIASNVRAVMRATSRNHGVTAAVETAAEALEADLDGAGVFVTLLHGHLDEETGRFRYIDAGHGLTIVVRPGGQYEGLAPTGVPLGVGWGGSWEERMVTLAPGDTLVSVSDGVLDALDGTLESLATVAQIAGADLAAQAVVDSVVAAVGDQAPDDMTVIAVHRKPVHRLGSALPAVS